ncbi:VOC family protein [Oceaniglobus trochenteri]|uniref:VOC family protein n=1 Tax=Oceaniglobus trochenteri TaxID=2763260 RepID=UPI001CFFCF57|nr:VOC family protein [Oceaniglobus trochenteri]
MLMGLHHVQLAMPKGGEADARAFYGGVLRMAEQPKPEALAKRGGCWFESGSVRVHLGVETPFAPAVKAHPGFLVASLSVVRDRLDAAGVTYEADGDYPGFNRIYITDPFGNRIELLERAD